MAASATPVIELWNDILTNRLVYSLTDGTNFSFGAMKLYQASKLSFRWYPLKSPSGFISAQNPFLQVAVAGLTLDIAVGPRAGVEGILARNNAWTDSGQGYLECVLNLNTVELNGAIAGSDSFNTWLEIQMTENGNTRPVYQESINLLSIVIGPTGAVSLPTAAAEYLTAAQQRAEFVRFYDNPPGSTIEMVSFDGTKTRLSCGVNNDGSAADNTSI
ncbi:MAG TPA: hypothetical protein VNT99_11055 [Methylomirabilota bacterium]|nr:hypothetical protein [Methylomirabilota bacterium]